MFFLIDIYQIQDGKVLLTHILIILQRPKAAKGAAAIYRVQSFVLYCFAALVYFKYMFNEEVRRMLVQVISSWQVLAATVVLVLYVFLVNYVARLYRRPGRPRRFSLPLPKRKRKAAAAEASPITPSENDELDLEEDVRPGKK